MSATGIKETAEVVTFLAGTIGSVRDALSDDRVTTWDVAAIIGKNLFNGVEAFKGISKVPAELADLDDEEAEEIYRTFLTNSELPDSEKNRAIFDAHYDFTRDCVRHWNRLSEIYSQPL